MLGYDLLRVLIKTNYNIDTTGIISKKEELHIKYDPIHKLVDFSGRIMHNDVMFSIIAYNSDSMFIGKSMHSFTVNAAYTNQHIVDSIYLHQVDNFKIDAIWPNGKSYFLTEKLYCRQNDKKLIYYVDTTGHAVLTCKFDKSAISELYNPRTLDTLFGNIIPVYHQRKTCDASYWKYDSLMNTCIEKAVCYEHMNEHYDNLTN